MVKRIKKTLLLTFAAFVLAMVMTVAASAKEASVIMDFDSLEPDADSKYTSAILPFDMATPGNLGNEGTDWQVVDDNGNKYIKINTNAKMIYSRNILRDLRDKDYVPSSDRSGVYGKITYSASLKADSGSSGIEILIGPENFQSGWLKGHASWGDHNAAIFLKADANAQSGSVQMSTGGDYRQLFYENGSPVTWNTDEWFNVAVVIDTVNQTIDFRLNDTPVKLNEGEKHSGIEGAIKGFRTYNKKSNGLSADNICLSYDASGIGFAVNKTINGNSNAFAAPDGLQEIGADKKVRLYVDSDTMGGSGKLTLYKGDEELESYDFVFEPGAFISTITLPSVLPSGYNRAEVTYTDVNGADAEPIVLNKLPLVDDCVDLSKFPISFKNLQPRTETHGDISPEAVSGYRKLMNSTESAYVMYQYPDIADFEVDLHTQGYETEIWISPDNLEDSWSRVPLVKTLNGGNEFGLGWKSYVYTPDSYIPAENNYLKVIYPPFEFDTLQWWSMLLNNVIIR